MKKRLLIIEDDIDIALMMKELNYGDDELDERKVGV